MTAVTVTSCLAPRVMEGHRPWHRPQQCRGAGLTLQQLQQRWHNKALRQRPAVPNWAVCPSTCLP